MMIILQNLNYIVSKRIKKFVYFFFFEEIIEILSKGEV